MMHTGEAIADVTDQIRKNQFKWNPDDPLIPGTPTAKAAQEMVDICRYSAEGEVVDASPFWRTVSERGAPSLAYEDICVAPPFSHGVVGFVIAPDCVVCTSHLAEDASRSALLEPAFEDEGPEVLRSIRWLYLVHLLIGGSGGPPTPPLASWVLAVGEDGAGIASRFANHEGAAAKEPTIFSAVSTGLPEKPASQAWWVFLSAMNLLNCSNVELVEPELPRPARRRMERKGLRVSEIHVRPNIRRSAAQPGPADDGLVPVHSVRGHFAHYGPKYDRGLLFGKYAGRFWVPQHARGDDAYGEVSHSYLVHPDD